MGVVTGRDNSSQTQQYNLIDEHALPRINYYRLKQMDKKGKGTYLNIVNVSFDGDANIVFTQPPLPIGLQ